MERNPVNFFRNFDKAAEGREALSQANYQLKILKKYFPNLVEGNRDIWKEQDPMAHLKGKEPSIFVESLFIENTKLKPSQALLKLPATVVWASYMKHLDEGNKSVVLVYPVEKLGNWVLHNLGPAPYDGIKKQVNILFYGDDGVNLMSQPLMNFIKERKIS